MLRFLKLIIVGQSKIESGFGRKLHTRVIELIIVVKPPVFDALALTPPPLFRHHQIHLISPFREMQLLPSFSFGPDVLGVIYIC